MKNVFAFVVTLAALFVAPSISQLNSAHASSQCINLFQDRTENASRRNDPVVKFWARQFVAIGQPEVFWRYAKNPKEEAHGVIRATVNLHAASKSDDLIKMSPAYVNAVTAVLEARFKSGDLYQTRRFFETWHSWPEFSSYESSDLDEAYDALRVHRNWFRQQANEPEIMTFGTQQMPFPMKPTVRGKSSNVQILSVRDHRYFFRAVGFGKNGDAARKTLAASRLNNDLALVVVPNAWKAIVNGQAGVLSSEALGSSRLFPPTKLYAGTRPDNLADVLAFELLVGNLDLHLGNLAYRGTGLFRTLMLEVFDHDAAFTIGSMWFYQSNHLGTSSLPSLYSRNFIESLQRLKPHDLHRDYADLLTNLEIEGLIFRREVILKDFELRGRPLAKLPYQNRSKPSAP